LSDQSEAKVNPKADTTARSYPMGLSGKQQQQQQQKQQQQKPPSSTSSSAMSTASSAAAASLGTVYFVEPTGGSRHGLLRKAFSLLDGEPSCSAVWLPEAQVPSVLAKHQQRSGGSGRAYFVFDDFQGAAYERAAAAPGCRLFGAQLLLQYLRDDLPLPKWEVPLFSAALKDLQISVSGIEDRATVKRKIRMLHGNFQPDLTDDVNVLITTCTNSKKYLVAKQFNIKVLLPEWLDGLLAWSRSRSVVEPFGLPDFARYVVPPFHNVTATTTNFEQTEKDLIQRLVVKNGGRYTGNLVVGECTHLIVARPVGQKYNYARNWKINCVSLQWVVDSDRKQCCLDIADYLVSDDGKNHAGAKPANSSTPDKQRVPLSGKTAPDVSCLLDPDRSRVNETVASVPGDRSVCYPVSSTAASTASAPTPQPPVSAASSGIDKENNFRIPNPPQPQPLAPLRDLRLLIACCRGQQAELQRLTSMARQLGASPISASSNQRVVEADAGLIIEPDQLEDLPAGVQCGVLVAKQWLLDCSEKQQRLPFDAYKLLWRQPAAADEAHETGDSTMGPGDAAPAAAAAPPASDMLEESLNILCDYVREEESQLKQQEQQAAEQDDEEGDETELPPVRSVVDNNSTAANVLPETEEPANSSTAADTQSFLTGRRVGILGLEPAAAAVAARSVTRLGGQVASAAAAEATQLDLAVLPVVYQRGSGGATEAGLLSADELVTDAWLADCIDGPAVMVADPDSEPWYRPCVLSATASKPLAGVVLCVSGFELRDRERVTTLGRGLGAIVQDNLSRVSKPDRQLRVTTHLVLAASGGHKYSAAMGWGSVHCVTKHWLGECGRQGRRLPEAEFHIDSLADYEERKRREAAAAAASAMSATMSSAADTPTATAVAMVTSTMASDCVVPASQASPMQQQQRQPANPHRAAMDSPSVFLNSGYRPRFDLQALSAALRSPVPGPPAGTPDSVQYARARRNIRQTCRAQGKRELLVLLPPPSSAAAIGGSANSAVATAADANGDFATPQTPQQAAGLLSGVTVYLSARLGAQRSRLAQLAESLGARSRWQWDPRTCTHLVAEGPPSDDPELQRAMQPQPAATASAPPPRLVSPAWLLQCKRLRRRLDERDYPPTSASSAAAAQPHGQHHHHKHHHHHAHQAQQLERRASRASLQELSSKLDCFGKGADNSPDGVSGDVAGANVNDIGGASAGTGGGSGTAPDSRLAQNRARQLLESEPDESAVCVGGGSGSGSDVRAAGKAATVASSVAANAAAAATAAVRPNEPLLVGWRYTDSDGAAAAPQPPPPQQSTPPEPPRLFQITGFSAQDRDRLVSQIRGLGGSLVSVESEDPSHLVCGRLLRNEKLLRCVAAGRWVLRPAYVEASAKAGRWLPEEPYEWGGGGGGAESADAETRLLAAACSRWRQRGGRAFRDWRAALLCPPDKLASFRRLLEAGGGRVVADGPPYPAAASVSHAFCQRGNYAGCSDTLSGAGSHLSWLRIDFIAAHLVDEKPPEPAAYRLPQARKRQQVGGPAGSSGAADEDDFSDATSTASSGRGGGSGGAATRSSKRIRRR
ncbi:hypothetical protein BOX15_Mlig030250g4, partial [Macrostomum lignano]